MSLARLFLVSFALMIGGLAAILFWTGPAIEAGGLAPFDPRSAGYDLAEARAFLTALTPEGRAAYLGGQRIADTVFPIGFLGVLAIAIVSAYRRWSVWLAGAMSLVPLGYFVFDMLENAAVAGMLRAGPGNLTQAAVAWASFCTIWKFRLVNAALALAGIGWAARGLAGLTRRRKPGQ